MNPKRQRFVEEYLIDLNATQAAIRAGYSPKTAKQIGDRLLTFVDVAEAVQKAKAERADRTKITADKVLNELAYIAFLDSRNLFEWGPRGVKVKDSAKLSDADARTVVEVSETVTESGGTIRVKTADKLAALKLVGQHVGLFEDKLKIGGSPDNPIEINVHHIATRIEQLRSAFRGVARRSSGGGVSSNGTGKPFHSNGHQGRDHTETG